MGDDRSAGDDRGGGRQPPLRLRGAPKDGDKDKGGAPKDGDKPKDGKPKGELTIRINMKNKGVRYIDVYPGDMPVDITRNFCREHKVSVNDKDKQQLLLKTVTDRIA